MNYSFEWLVSSELSFAGPNGVASAGRQLILDNAPDLLDLFPFNWHWNGESGVGHGWFATVVRFEAGTGMNVGGSLSKVSLERLQPAIQNLQLRTHQELRELLGADMFSPTRFTYIGPMENGHASYPHLVSHVIEWIEQTVAPDAMARNEARVLRVLPRPPQYDIGVFDAIWILECEIECKQGTAFMLDGVGLVTCEHVLGARTQAFRANAHSVKYDVRVLKRHATLDLAVLELIGASEPALAQGSAENLKNFDPIAVAGFPNFNYGDSGRLVPGVVVGFRMASGVRRVLTNAPIIAGNSGGPVLNANNEVIGVAVTGADRMEEASDTEKHGFIPIEALALLPNDLPEDRPADNPL